MIADDIRVNQDPERSPRRAFCSLHRGEGCSEPVFLDARSAGLPECAVCNRPVSMRAWRARDWVARDA